MRAVVQRVLSASVGVGEDTVASIGLGLLCLVGVTHDDTPASAAALARKIHTLRILRDEQSVSDSPTASVLVVSQFTLYGDARKGRRPSWSAAAPGHVAEPLVEAVAQALRETGTAVQIGRFGADMRVELVNDGPFTVVLDI